MRVALDLDGVCYEFDRTARFMIARRLGYAQGKDLPWNHDEYNRGVDKEHWSWLFGQRQIDPLFRHGHLYRGAIEGVRELAKRNDVVVVTKRPRRATQVTLEWLAYNRLPVSEVHVLQGLPKSSVPCDIYIDDRIDVVQEILDNTNACVVLFEQPWNRTWPVELKRMFGRIEVADGWSDMPRALNDLDDLEAA